MSKLQNVKAVKDMLAGTHKTQTRKTFSIANTKKEVPDEDIIERDENGEPKIWIEQIQYLKQEHVLHNMMDSKLVNQKIQF